MMRYPDVCRRRLRSSLKFVKHFSNLSQGEVRKIFAVEEAPKLCRSEILAGSRYGVEPSWSSSVMVVTLTRILAKRTSATVVTTR
jgi:hypothetical protein